MSTKIINVQRNDSFEELFDLFKEAQAQEVIFIFPKGTKFNNNPQYFELLKIEGDQGGKKISIMSSDPFVIELAAEQGLNILQTTARPRSSVQTTIAQVPVMEEPMDSNVNEPIAVLAAARKPASTRLGGVVAPHLTKPRVIRDIVRGDLSDHALEVELPDDASEQEVEIKSTPSIEPVVETPVQMPPPLYNLDNLKERAEKEVVDGGVKKRIEENQLADKNDIVKLWSEEEKRFSSEMPTGIDVKKIGGSGRLSSIIFRKATLFIVGGAIIALGLVLYLTLGSARIVIKPKKQDVDITVKMTSSTEIQSIETDSNKIPGQKFTSQTEVSQTFPASGKKDVAQKATGTVTLYNKSSKAQKLVATTRLESSKGLIFRIPETVTVPAATSDTAPGAIDSAIYADKPGNEYNIDPDTFTIPGFAGKPEFALFSAKSTKPVSGGVIGPSSIVTEKDYLSAQSSLMSQLKTALIEELKSQAGDLTVIGGPIVTFEKPVANAKPDEAAENLQMKLKGSAQVIAFRESDAIKLVNSLLSKEAKVGLLTKDLSIAYGSASLDNAGALMTFDASVSGKAAGIIDSDKILKNILGMNEAQIRSYLNGVTEIESVRIILSPRWVHNVPKDKDKVKLEVDY